MLHDVREADPLFVHADIYVCASNKEPSFRSSHFFPPWYLLRPHTFQRSPCDFVYAVATLVAI